FCVRADLSGCQWRAATAAEAVIKIVVAHSPALIWRQGLSLVKEPWSAMVAERIISNSDIYVVLEYRFCIWATIPIPRAHHVVRGCAVTYICIVLENIRSLAIKGNGNAIASSTAQR